MRRWLLSGVYFLLPIYVPKLEHNLNCNFCQGCFELEALSGGVNLMGRASRHTPKRLAEKLSLIRKHLGVETLEEMAARLGVKEVNLYRSTIHEYECGNREPPLIVLLRYSELSGITINDLVDDKVSLKL